MLKYIMPWVFLGITQIWSCDICGGVSGNASIGLFASTQFHMIGLKTGSSSFKSYLHGIEHSRENLWSTEVSCRWQIGKRLQLMASVPYQFGFQTTDLSKAYISGLGDPTAILNGILVNQKDSTGRVRQFLSLGIGLKAPFGKWNPKSEVRNLYPGSGAYNILGMLNYTTPIKPKWTLQSEIVYNYKLSDTSGFRYGNVFSLTETMIGNYKWGIGRFIPGFGIGFSNFGKVSVSDNGSNEMGYNGNMLNLKAHLNYLTYRWLWTSQIEIPVAQNVNNRNVKQKLMAQIGFSYLIRKK